MQDLHVFHYAGHSAVWSIRTAPTPVGGLLDATRDGSFLTRQYLVFRNRAEAEAYVGDIAETSQRNTDFEPVQVHRHKPTASKYAVRVEADDPEDDRPMRGWLIYGPDGRHQYVINDPDDTPTLADTTALGDAGVTVVLGEPIKLTARAYMSLCAPF